MRALWCAVFFACLVGNPPAPTPGADPPASDDSPCASDGDCALTWVGEGQCCPMLCAPRVVTAKRAAELKQKSTDCGRPCPHPLCMPPRQRLVPACQQNRCAGKAVGMPED